MEEAKSMAQHHHQQQQHQQQQLMLEQYNQQQHNQQQMMFIQQQKQHNQQQMLFIQQQKLQQQQQQQAAISRFPSNIDAHLRPTNLNRQIHLQQQQQIHQNPNPIIPNFQNQQQLHQHSTLNAQQQQQQQQQQVLQQKAIRPPGNQLELQMAYQDAYRVCHPDFKRPFSSLEDACERLLPYHVVADYEAEEDDKILDSDSTGQMPSRSQQWDHNIAAKVAECLVTFEKQALAFNIISRKRSAGEFRCEERLMIEQALLQEEKRAMLELRTEIDSREKAKLRMEAMAQAEQARAESRAEMMARGPIRANAVGSQGNNNVSMGRDIAEHEEGINQDAMINGWGNNAPQRDEKEPSEDFLNDEENENEDACNQDEWREVGEFDLNTR